MIFINNKYTKWYNNIISKAIARTLPEEIYTEKHHIIPRSLKGRNSHSNLAILTAKEHFICHHLLTKMTVGVNKQKMAGAFLMMSVKNKYQTRYLGKITAKMYEKYRVEYSLYNSAINLIRNANLTSVERKKLYAHYGEDNGFFNKKHSDDSLTLMSVSHKNQRAILFKCDICGKSCDKQNFIKYHGEKCLIQNKGVSGRKWFYLGEKNYYVYIDDPQISILGLIAGRIPGLLKGYKKKNKSDRK